MQNSNVNIYRSNVVLSAQHLCSISLAKEQNSRMPVFRVKKSFTNTWGCVTCAPYWVPPGTPRLCRFVDSTGLTLQWSGCTAPPRDRSPAVMETKTSTFYTIQYSLHSIYLYCEPVYFLHRVFINLLLLLLTGFTHQWQISHSNVHIQTQKHTPLRVHRAPWQSRQDQPQWLRSDAQCGDDPNFSSSL